MIVYAPVLVVDNQNRGIRPKLRIVTDRVVDRRDKLLAGSHIVIRVLITGK